MLVCWAGDVGTLTWRGVAGGMGLITRLLCSVSVAVCADAGHLDDVLPQTTSCCAHPPPSTRTQAACPSAHSVSLTATEAVLWPPLPPTTSSRPSWRKWTLARFRSRCGLLAPGGCNLQPLHAAAAACVLSAQRVPAVCSYHRHLRCHPARHPTCPALPPAAAGGARSGGVE